MFKISQDLRQYFFIPGFFDIFYNISSRIYIFVSSGNIVGHACSGLLASMHSDGFCWFQQFQESRDIQTEETHNVESTQFLSNELVILLPIIPVTFVHLQTVYGKIFQINYTSHNLKLVDICPK